MSKQFNTPNYIIVLGTTYSGSGAIYDFGPGPVIWSCKVWESLHKHYVSKNNLQFADLINVNPSEFTWYGEWLLASQ